jgi:phosphohistidine phosphatase
MKELLLMRHAKSDWDTPFEGDHERPLSRKGIRDAQAIGLLLRRLDLVPDRAVSSSAVRARRTLEMAASAGDWHCRQEATPDLYECSVEQAFQVLQRAGRKPSRVLLVGHNPVWEEFLACCVGGGRFRLGTASLALVRFPHSDWAEVEPGSGTLVWLVKPKLLEAVSGAG